MKMPASAELTPIKNTSVLQFKTGGLFLIERNMILLAEAGVKKFYLPFTRMDHDFFERKVKKRIIKRFPDLHIYYELPKMDGTLKVPSNLFFQKHDLQQKQNFRNNGEKGLEFICSEKIFEIDNRQENKKAEKLLTDKIISDTGGVIARKLNKKLSIPISLLICKTRIHPNILTMLNFLVGILSAFYLYKSADTSAPFSTRYLYMALGGILFQAASVFDGVDGEVAKLTMRTSKLGGWLDTIVDNVSLLLLLASASLIQYRTFGGQASTMIILILVVSLIVIFGFLFYYTTNFSETQSMTAFDNDVIQKAPQEDILIRFSKITRYLVKKELFSLGIFFACIAGLSILILPGATLIGSTTAVIILIIFFRYRHLAVKR